MASGRNPTVDTLPIFLEGELALHVAIRLATTAVLAALRTSRQCARDRCQVSQPAGVSAGIVQQCLTLPLFFTILPCVRQTRKMGELRRGTAKSLLSNGYVLAQRSFRTKSL